MDLRLCSPKSLLEIILILSLFPERDQVQKGDSDEPLSESVQKEDHLSPIRVEFSARTGFRIRRLCLSL